MAAVLGDDNQMMGMDGGGGAADPNPNDAPAAPAANAPSHHYPMTIGFRSIHNNTRIVMLELYSDDTISDVKPQVAQALDMPSIDRIQGDLGGWLADTDCIESCVNLGADAVFVAVPIRQAQHPPVANPDAAGPAAVDDDDDDVDDDADASYHTSDERTAEMKNALRRERDALLRDGLSQHDVKEMMKSLLLGYVCDVMQETMDPQRERFPRSGKSKAQKTV